MSHRTMTARDIVVRYQGGPPVLRGATIDVPAARRVSLLGANGSGKTTLLRCLSGAVEPDAGRVEIDDVPLRYSRSGLRAHRQEVQLVLQDPDDQLFSVDVYRDVAYGPVNLGLTAGEIRDRTDAALDVMGIDHLRSRPTHQLSYGERKRVATAGAVAMRPCILLLDEPTAGLDPQGVDEMFAALSRLENAHTTVVLSTHDVALALEWSHSVAVVVDGVVVQGDPVTLLSDEDLVRQARLRTPWTLALAAELAADGLLDPNARPRNAAELRESLAASRNAGV
ncbi:energy-coupling factor ABC transporter ATP-binding protein [Rhodococcus sp. MEB064]|uniref:energy-coupling factor ABC transporter ATP-binding protein n=1 Tax=Rhodococcus sp. MEB064 TaxID=1587522 RepID=UPI0005ABD667|nr:ATP-binding cassette domain-containing protein [Rhodococcus sp. MEB064]KIQ18144.1 cobalt ABC transporter ATP-binding protein [Rhodococcus sp. MEB064]